MFALKIDSELELRLLEERHSEELFARVDRNRLHLKKWLPWLDGTKSVSDTKDFIRSSLEGFSKGKGQVVGIWVAGKIAGVISFNRIDSANRKASIGYWLDSEHTGKGVMTRACRALVDYAFRELKLNRVEIACATENRKSRAIPERLGLKEEGRSRQAEWLYDRFVDHVNYAVVASDWQGSAESPNPKGT